MNKTDQAFAALEQVLTLSGADERLPMPSVNDSRLDTFDETGRQLALRKGDTLIIGREVGDDGEEQFELQLEVEILFAVAGDDVTARSLKVAEGEAAFGDLLFADETLGGQVDELSIQDVIERSVIHDERRAVPVQVVRFTVALLHSAPTVFG